MVRPLSLAAFLIAAAPAASAQVHVVPSPLQALGTEPGLDALRVGLDRAALASLAAQDQLVLAGVPLPDGRAVDLELQRIRTERMKFTFFVDDLPRPDLAQGLGLSVWKGRVRGEPGSEAMLSFSATGAQGWITRAGTMVHVMPRPDAQGDWTRGDSLLATDAELNRIGMRFEPACAAEPAPSAAGDQRGPRSRPAMPAGGGSTQQVVGGCGLRECKVAITSDFQWYQRFNNLAAQANYTMTLFGFVSDRYENQVNTILTFPYVAFYTTANDPWSAQDVSGNNCQAVLTELQGAWVGNVPANANLGHLMSGANLGCGVAWLDVLCNGTYNFSVAGNMNGTVSFPIVQQPNNWDFIVCAHELGHNFDALHTHDYCPPLDECAPSGYFGSCQTAQVCTNQGTIMSYCHLCPGGHSNMTTLFHPTSAADMTAAANACLPLFAGIRGQQLTDVVQPGVTSRVSAHVSGTPSGPVQVLWRANPSGSFTAVNLTSVGNGVYTGTIPGFACSDDPQFYYAYTDTTCTPGVVTDPPGAPGATYGIEIAAPATTISLDNFQADSGWTASNLGATSGDWQRGVPVNDAGWDYDPLADGDGSGACWLTQNAAGNTDVDGGAVQLLSAPLDLSSPTLVVEYWYYLRLTNSNGDDRLLVEVSANGTGGPWVQLAAHANDGGTSWRLAHFERSDFLAAGVNPGATARMRFTANDGGTASIVESGLDGFRIAAETCQPGANYCTSTVNSSGGAALMSPTGSNSIAANNLVLRALPTPPSTPGIFFFGQTQTQTAFGNGIRCVGGTVFRLSSVNAVAGVLSRPFNNAVPPAAGMVVAGSTWNFQAWFRDPAAGGSNFNLSDGYQIQFVP